jgi:Mrp family chromosome partitioning ATPase
VIFDIPPLLGTDDAMIILSQVDCVLVVVGNGMVGKTELTESMRYIDSDKLLGTVLNKSNSEHLRRGYYDY